MSTWSYLTSIFANILLFAPLVLLPSIALWKVFPLAPRPVCFAATMGIYAVALNLKPAVVPLWILPLLAVTLSTYVVRRSGAFKAFVSPLSDKTVLFVLAFSFSVFLFRWDPPGYDPVKWASIARLILETGGVPGDTWPLTPIRDLKGANVGFPLLASLHALFGVSLERAVSFYNGVSLALFVFAFGAALRLWFSEKNAQTLSVVSLLIFTVPQAFQSWGGTPTLLGMVSGLVCFAYVARVRQGKVTFAETCVFALAISFGAYAHPVGFLAAMLVSVPMLLVGGDQAFFKRVVPLLALGAAFFLPFFLYFPKSIGDKETALTLAWQKTSAPLLFRDEYTWLYNLYSQTTAYVWNTAGVMALVLCIWALAKNYRNSFGRALFVGLLIPPLLVENARFHLLPLSLLLYPERCGAFWIFPLMLGVGWAWNQWENKIVQRRVFVSVVILLGLIQFQKRTVPLLFSSEMTAKDKVAYQKVADLVPAGDCISVSSPSAAKWIAPLALRCTVPFHGVAVNTLSSHWTKDSPNLRYVFRADGEFRGDLPQTEPLFDNGAALWKLKE